MQRDYVPMQKEVIAITQKEATRYDVLRRVLDGTISLMEAAAYMGVSYSQTHRHNQNCMTSKGTDSLCSYGDTFA